ncbi:hypothetical protein CMV30_12060 [Nibricoccus aquaticus]|uniref:Transmembrane protein n=1 Tax=Nibricoccus aquaticus TaxID=2576891 RepID=A0A290Q867_9BACT|nr:hypothetical protein [Nibricoccus aquaticus]ATC64633.1 hypothetical protein CMV30_12060 [Nibricoccus aquaticus]
MANNPPPLPSEILSRVLRVASMDGRLLMIVAGTMAILHAAAHQSTGAIVGVLVAGTGAIELHGASQLRSGDPRGMDWLVRSQLLLLATMLLYSAYQLTHFDPATVEQIPFTPEQLEAFKVYRLSKETAVYYAHIISYTTVGLVTLIYQGLMALYYHRRRSAVATALDEELFDALDDRD